ncbi:hypothetical protein [Leptospira alstonii]|uniref:Uncharacterized protein n=2 Tax=Leptospira alstonii TaxID=28452 RepID=M6CKG4_9LEPT|nr:hypothetical protein [Leptospira alstonii]EMJ91101.1 hypothetical protein LEP1GSC194_0080 [Leptospira alstonii serovar Sichuan str. 79601]EQA80772.1 hypothetical protein LEP1GSC193_3123 [Leptospira alstonii serovar Pingchang str. 80-412]
MNRSTNPFSVFGKKYSIWNYATFAFLLFALTGPLFSQTQGGYYALVYSKTGVIGSVEFNGMTIVSESGKEDVSGQIELNVWILPGVNKIKVKVKGIRKRKEDEFSPKIKAILYLAQKGQFPDEGQKIAGFEWEEGEGKPTLPLEQEITFTPTEVPPSELWKIAEEIQLNAEDKEKIQKLITDLYNGFQKKDEKKLLELMDFRTKEFARARYYSPEDEVKDLKKGIQNVLKTIGGKLDKLDLDELQYQLIADKKAVAVTSKSGKSPIENKKKGFSVPLYFSKVQGEWIISR